MEDRNQLSPCFRIVRGDITPHAVLRTTVADHDPAFDYTRRLRNGVGFGRINGQSAPHRLARPGIECHQAPVKRADIDLAFPGGHTSIDHVATAAHSQLSRDLGIVGPQQRTTLGVERLNQTPGRRDVHHPIDDERCRLLPPLGIQIRVPGEPELPGVTGSNPVQRTESLFAVGSAAAYVGSARGPIP